MFKSLSVQGADPLHSGWKYMENRLACDETPPLPDGAPILTGGWYRRNSVGPGQVCKSQTIQVDELTLHSCHRLLVEYRPI